MEQFPCPIELTVASALLLLSTTPPSLSPSVFDFQDDDSLEEAKQSKSCRGSLVLSDSKNSSSSSITADASSMDIRARKMKLAAVVPRHYEMKLKVVRKSRTKIYRSSNCQNISSGKAEATSYGSALIETSSCMSSSSSAASSVRSRNEGRGSQKLAMVRDDRTRRNIGSTHIRRRAEAILKMLSGGCFSEVRIRQELGDSPDTSKALRMLLKLEEVKRSGTGGRQDPYKYRVAG